MLSRRPAGQPPSHHGRFPTVETCRVFQARGNTDIRCLWVLPFSLPSSPGRFASFTLERARACGLAEGAQWGPPCAPAPAPALGSPSSPEPSRLCSAPRATLSGGPAAANRVQFRSPHSRDRPRRWGPGPGPAWG